MLNLLLYKRMRLLSIYVSLFHSFLVNSFSPCLSQPAKSKMLASSFRFTSLLVILTVAVILVECGPLEDCFFRLSSETICHDGYECQGGCNSKSHQIFSLLPPLLWMGITNWFAIRPPFQVDSNLVHNIANQSAPEAVNSWWMSASIWTGSPERACANVGRSAPHRGLALVDHGAWRAWHARASTEHNWLAVWSKQFFPD